LALPKRFNGYLQRDRLSPESPRAACGRRWREIANHDSGCSCQSDDDERDADGWSFHEGVWHGCSKAESDLIKMIRYVV
jgi:hypothetical protein